MRLFIDQPLAPGQPILLPKEAAHYLFSVMRLGPGAEVALFNGRDGGEWLAEVAEAGRKGGVLAVTGASRPALLRPDLWLLFAPVKKAGTDLIVQKASELGAARLLPVLTDYTHAERVRPDRLEAIAREAAEQSGATSLPEIAQPVKLAALLAEWEPERELWFADEALAEASERAGAAATSCAPTSGSASRTATATAALDPFATAPAAPFAPGPKGAVLIGPEGGFSPDERARLLALPFARPLGLGRRILRAETAAIAALTLWLAARGFP